MLDLETAQPDAKVAVGASPDLSGLTAFLDMFDADQRPAFITAFVEEMEDRHAALCKACQAKDGATIRRQAHGIKGTSATFQLDVLSQQAAGVENFEGDGVDLLTSTQALADRLSLTLKAIAALDPQSRSLVG